MMMCSSVGTDGCEGPPCGSARTHRLRDREAGLTLWVPMGHGLRAPRHICDGPRHVRGPSLARPEEVLHPPRCRQHSVRGDSVTRGDDSHPDRGGHDLRESPRNSAPVLQDVTDVALPGSRRAAAASYSGADHGVVGVHPRGAAALPERDVPAHPDLGQELVGAGVRREGHPVEDGAGPRVAQARTNSAGSRSASASARCARRRPCARRRLFSRTNTSRWPPRRAPRRRRRRGRARKPGEAVADHRSRPSPSRRAPPRAGSAGPRTRMFVRSPCSNTVAGGRAEQDGRTRRLDQPGVVGRSIAAASCR